MNIKTKRIRIVALVLTTIMLLSLTACGSRMVINSNNGKTEQAEDDSKVSGNKNIENDNSNKTESEEYDVRITQTEAKTIQTEKYETTDFSIMIPKGWEVKTDGANMSTFISISDPSEPRNTMFFKLKLEPLLHSQEGKDTWQAMYDNGDTSAAMFAQAPVLTEASTEGLFRTICSDFTVTDRFPASTDYGAFALGDEILRADFTDATGAAEGIFTASVVDFGSFPISDGTVIDYQLQTVDGGYYMAYNVMGITAAKDTLLEWSDVLLACMSSLQFTDSFITATNQASDDQVTVSRQISQNFNQTMDGIMAAWENRNRSQDIMSQKQSDATLGYERVYDTETGEIYKATNGFTDVYDGRRFQPVTDDNMYAEPISGYIEKQ